MANKFRLNKYLAMTGLVSSRRRADEVIFAKKVRLNGRVVESPSVLVSTNDQVNLNGKLAKLKSDIYIVFYKPKGVICSHVRQGKSLTVFDLLPKNFNMLKIAGRLDKQSEGLLVLSSDGDFIQKLTHPKYKKQKTYIVDLKEPITHLKLQELKNGVDLNGRFSKFRLIKKITPTKLKIVLEEGRNRQIRRTIEAIGNTVIRLERVGIGSYFNDQLGPGKYVFIKPSDLS